ncbi:PHD finger protein 20 isoform X3 [Thrips palmi]|uniref:PHD finger protein 20 isoform X3 n=1 Tax=Thrips palmi TaxID=161013 RepID=A0A6P9A8V5_THRPL|nr:PHD finger protein 20 isoform X3 [Thrips palmi]
MESPVIKSQAKMASLGPLTPGRKKSVNGSSTPGNGKKIRLSPAGQSYVVGSKVEAKDFSGQWNSAKVSEVDWDEREILIHFEKYDEWMPMDSQRVRPYKEPDASSLYPANLNLGRISGMKGRYFPEPKPLERRFKVGDRVMATWTNNRKYPATIANQLPNDRYDVVFYDGFAKSVRGSKISKMKDSELMVPPSNGSHLPMQSQFQLHQQQAIVPNQLKSQQLNGNLSAGNSFNRQPKVNGQLGQTQLEKQLLQPPTLPSASQYTMFSPPVNGLLSFDENIGTKEQRRERKRKHNVKELFSTKRPRGSEKISSSKARLDKKSQAGIHSDTGVVSSLASSSSNVQSPVNGLLLGVDPMFPANPLKVEGLPSSGHGVKDKPSLDLSETDVKKRRKRLKKKQDGFGSDTQETTSQKRSKAGSSDEDECSIQWTNGEPQGEAAYVIESAEGLRKSIIVDDRRLPVGWSKHAIRRQGGTSAGKWDVFLVSPRDGRKFRSRNELRSYHDERGLQFQVERFDFSLGRKKMYRQKAAAAAAARAAQEDRPDASSPVPSSHASEASGVPSSPSSFSEHSTPQQIGLHPPAPHSITPQVVSQGIQRVKTLLPRRTSTSSGSPSRRISSPPPPHAITPQPILPVSSTLESLNKKSLSAGSDGFSCPKDQCGKKFRKENLLQMHIKHYHPEYTAFMGSTPNVADLAYARCTGEGETPNRNRPGQGSSFMEKIEKISRMEAHRKAGAENPTSGAETLSSLEARSPTLGQLLKKGPMRKDSLDGTTAAAQAAAAWMVETASDAAAMSPLADALRDKSSPNLQIPLESGYRDKMECVSRPLSRAAGLNSDCDQDGFVEQNGNLSPWKGMGTEGIMSASASSSPVTVQPPPSYFYSKKKKSRVSADKLNSTVPKLEGGKPPSPPMEHLRREELINCTCGFMEEDGLMIQCDLCLCWQHGLCNQIENIEDVPQKYVCQICQNPVRERKSRHFIHDQDWLKEGVLPSLPFTVKESEKVQQREDILKRSHDLCSLLLLTQKVIHSLRVKVHIAEQKDHPKLYLWANSWQTESMGCPTPPSSPTQAIDQKPESFDAPRIPQPEAPIDPGECRIKLLDHIEHYQSLIDARLTTLEHMIDELEKEDPSLLDGKNAEAETAVRATNGIEADELPQSEEDPFFPQTKETVQMILRDLQKLTKISTLC